MVASRVGLGNRFKRQWNARPKAPVWATVIVGATHSTTGTWTYRVAHQVAVSYVMGGSSRLLGAWKNSKMSTDAAEGQAAANQRINVITRFGEERF